MSQFYTKEQIDAQGAHIASAINNKIRETVDNLSIEEATDISSFTTAFDQALADDEPIVNEPPQVA